MSTQTEKPAKALSLKQKVEALENDHTVSNMTAFHAELALDIYKAAKRNAVIYGGLAGIFTLFAGADTVHYFNAKAANEAFEPAKTAAEIAYTSENKILAETKGRVLNKLAPPEITKTAEREYVGNGVFITKEIHVPSTQTSINTAQFNFRVQQDLKSQESRSIRGVVIETGIILCLSSLTYSHMAAMRNKKEIINRIYDENIDTTKVQPLNPRPSGPGQHG